MNNSWKWFNLNKTNEKLALTFGTKSDLDFPSLVSIQLSDFRHFCGGNIIDELHIVTAAHCMIDSRGNNLQPSQFHVMAGDIGIEKDVPGVHRIYRKPNIIFIHPNYTIKTHENDISVIRLKEKLPKIYKILQPLPIARTVPEPGTMCWVAGWGTPIPYLNLIVTKQLKVNVNVIDFKRCSLTYGETLKKDIMFCAGAFEGGRDACKGDSGGGLYCNNTLTGLVSFGRSCGHPLFPGIYVNVTAYSTWIESCKSYTGKHQFRNSETSKGNLVERELFCFITILTQFFLVSFK